MPTQPDIERVRVACRELEDALRPLLQGEFSSLHIGLNKHASSYCDVEKAAGDDWKLIDPEDWVSDDERAEAIKLNRAWSLQWYPRTPVGFCKVVASTLEAAVVDALRQHEAD